MIQYKLSDGPTERLKGSVSRLSTILSEVKNNCCAHKRPSQRKMWCKPRWWISIPLTLAWTLNTHTHKHTHTGTDGVLAYTGKCVHLPALTHPMTGCTSAPKPWANASGVKQGMTRECTPPQASLTTGLSHSKPHPWVSLSVWCGASVWFSPLMVWMGIWEVFPGLHQRVTATYRNHFTTPTGLETKL